ncbi:MAG: hypothetical protein AB3N16_13355, partial [Flavobacteriaceae bacterium]
NSNAVYGNNSAMGNHVGYSFVEETILDANDISKTNGRIVTEYINKPNQQLHSTHRGQIAFDAPSTLFEEGNGQIKTQKIYDNGFGTDPKRIISNNYDPIFTDGAPGVKVYYSNMRGFLIGSIGGNGISVAWNVLYDRFPYQTRRSYSLLESSTVTDYLENGTSHETKTYNTYNSKPQMTATKTINSKGEELETRLYYPYDSYLGVSSLPRMSNLVDDNRIANPVYTRNFYQGQLLNHELTTYDYKLGNLKPVKIAFQKEDAPLNEIEVRFEYDTYNRDGKPLKFRKDNGPWTEIIWGYENVYPIAQIYNAPENGTPLENILNETLILDSNSTAATIKGEIDKVRDHADYQGTMISSYAFDPMVGMVQSQDERSYTTSYVYDPRERLAQIKDEDNRIIQDYKYGLGNELNDCLENCAGDLTVSTSTYQLFREQSFTINYSINGSFSVNRWEIWYGDGTSQSGSGSPSGLSHAYSEYEDLGLKPIRLYLYNGNDGFITGNVNVRLYEGNIPGSNIFFDNINLSSNQKTGRIYGDPGSKISFTASVAGSSGQHSGFATIGGQSISLSAYESQTGTVTIPSSGYIECSVSATLNGSSSATCTISITGTNTGQVVSPSSLSFTASNF